MTNQVKGTLKRARPWDGQARWWLVLGEGAVALVLGAYILLQPQQAVTGVGQALLPGKTPRGFIGLLIFGLLILQILTFDSGVTLLAIGMLLYGVLGLVVGFLDRGQGGIRWGVVLNSLFFAAVGFVVLFVQQVNVMVDWVGPLLVIFGIALIAFAILRRIFIREA